jgi:hypothetical protein
VVDSSDIVGALTEAVQDAIAVADVDEAIVVLARHGSGGSGRGTLGRLVNAPRCIDRVAPLVLPPPPHS